MRDIEKEAEERFKSDTKEHQMTVLLDSGLNRCLQFRKKGCSAYHFNVTTWPGYLCISGDMGCFVFSREADMFGFFSTRKMDINPHYWAEKIQHDKGGVFEFSIESFTENLRDYLDDRWDLQDLIQEEESWEGVDDNDESAEPKMEYYWQEPSEKEKYSRYDWQYHNASYEKGERHGPFESEEAALNDLKAALWSEIEEDVDFDNNEVRTYDSATAFKSKLTGKQFYDFWECSSREYTFHYLWVCHAIIYAIKAYDAYKSEKQPRHYWPSVA